MNFKSVIEKGQRKLLKKRSKIFYNTKAHALLYSSYWHSILFNTSKTYSCSQYLTAKPNWGAGIGHQMANWIAGLWFSKIFNLEFSHSQFSGEWESVLGLGYKMKCTDELINQGFKKVRLPLFDEKKISHLNLITEIISSYKGQKVIFVLDFDQFYADQYGISSNLQKMFFESPSRANDKLEYNPLHFNIACHIRRGDILQGANGSNNNLTMRFQSDDYYKQILEQVIQILPYKENISIYVYSQGSEYDFEEFKKFGNVHLRINDNPYSSFLHMVYADLLITSKSSFSYKPSLISKGFKICPKDFWHGYPNSSDFILADNDGRILNLEETNKMEEINRMAQNKIRRQSNV